MRSSADNGEKLGIIFFIFRFLDQNEQGVKGISRSRGIAVHEPDDLLDTAGEPFSDGVGGAVAGVEAGQGLAQDGQFLLSFLSARPVEDPDQLFPDSRAGIFFKAAQFFGPDAGIGQDAEGQPDGGLIAAEEPDGAPEPLEFLAEKEPVGDAVGFGLFKNIRLGFRDHAGFPELLEAEVPDDHGEIGAEAALVIISLADPGEPLDQLAVHLLDQVGHVAPGKVALVGEALDDNADDGLIFQQEFPGIFPEEFDIVLVLQHPG